MKIRDEYIGQARGSSCEPTGAAGQQIAGVHNFEATGVPAPCGSVASLRGSVGAPCGSVAALCVAVWVLRVPVWSLCVRLLGRKKVLSLLPPHLRLY